MPRSVQPPCVVNIEDLRKLADQFHRTADRALEELPEQGASYGAVEGNGGSAPVEAQSA